MNFLDVATGSLRQLPETLQDRYVRNSKRLAYLKEHFMHHGTFMKGTLKNQGDIERYATALELRLMYPILISHKVEFALSNATIPFPRDR